MKKKIAILSILANVVLAGTKIVVGYLANAASVLAEGFHSLTDIFSSVIGYFGIKASDRPADSKHPYGHYKIEVLSGLIITLILFATGVGIIYDAYRNYLNPEKIKIDYLILGIMLVSALINFITAKIKIYYGKKENSLTLLSDGSHDYADVLVSLAVFFGLILGKYWVYSDAFLAFLIGIYIIKESFSLGKEAADSLLDASAGEEVEKEIQIIAQANGVKISSLKTQKKGSSVTANLEIELPKGLSVEEATRISDQLKNQLIKKIDNLKYVAIQIRDSDTETSFYRSAWGKGFGWQRRSQIKINVGKIIQNTSEYRGPKGDCVCPECGYTEKHERGTPCSQKKCPICQVNLERK